MSSQQLKPSATSKNSETIAKKSNDVQSNLTIDEFIAVQIESEKQKNTANIFIAEIAEIDETDVGLRYISCATNKYIWPKNTEYLWQPINYVVIVLPEPHLLDESEQFMFENCSLEDIILKALSLCGIKYTNFK